MSDGRRLRIVLVLGTSGGGVGRHVRALAEGLVDRGWAVVVAGPAATDAAFDFGRTGAHFVSVDIADRPRPAADSRAVWSLRSTVSAADVVHAHGLRAGGLAALALAARRQPPLVATLHNARPVGGGAAGRAYAVLERLVARKARVVLGVSADLEESMQALGVRDVRYALVPAPAMAPSGRSRREVLASLGVDEPEVTPVVLAAGRLSEQKGYPLLLDAAAAWARRRPQPMVLVAGDGPLHDELSARVVAERLPVKLLGRRDDVPDLMRAADVFVLPSVWEGQPLVAQEALRAGVPIVATAVGGVPDLVGDAAVLTPSGDAAAFAAAVSGLLTDPVQQARLHAAALRRAMELPTDTDALDQVEQVYRDVLAVEH